MSQLFKSILGNLTSMLLAFVLAVIIWAAAVRGANPLVTEDFVLTLTIIERPDAILRNEPETRVQIQVEAAQNTMAQLSASDFEAFIDLNGVDFGNSDVPIQLELADDAVDIDLATVQIFPRTTEVELDRLITVELPVNIRVQGNPAGTHSIGSTVADPATVSVTGPATRLNVLKEARATVFLDSTTRDTRTVTRQLIFYDKQDNPVSLNSAEIEISASEASVTVEIEELAGVADVAIRARWRGRTATGYRFLSAVPEPRSVLVQGSPEVIQNLRSIPTEEIDISGLVAPEIFRVALELPEGVTLLDSNPVVVEVDVERIFTTDSFIATPTVIGLGEELTATIGITEVNVILFGPLEALDTISDDDVRVDVSLFGLEEGEHDVELVVSPPPLEGIETRSFQPDIITVVISSIVTETITNTQGITGTESLTSTEGADEGSFWTVPHGEPLTASFTSTFFAASPRRYA